VERVIGLTLQPGAGKEPTVTAAFDVRSIPLDTLLQDVHVRHMVSKILARMDGPARVSVAKFNSSI
jgi:hypothetical protein